jgi:hypothetical protein
MPGRRMGVRMAECETLRVGFLIMNPLTRFGLGLLAIVVSVLILLYQDRLRESARKLMQSDFLDWMHSWNMPFNGILLVGGGVGLVVWSIASAYSGH